MTSTPVILLLLRSGQASDRPSGVTVQAGQLALSYGAADPGLYFEDSAGTVAKIGPPSYGPNAPNSSPVGLAGNYQGELWTDSSTGSGFLRVWNGSTFANMNVAFATSAGNANVSNSTVLASGALGAVTASGALGAVLASGSLGAVLASGALSALVASGSANATVASGADGAVLASGALGSITASGTPFASGALGAVLASGALGAVAASGALGAVAASGAIIASGVGAGASISISGLPASSTTPSGALIYNAIPSGTQGSGLYVRVYTDYVRLF